MRTAEFTKVIEESQVEGPLKQELLSKMDHAKILEELAAAFNANKLSVVRSKIATLAGMLGSSFDQKLKTAGMLLDKKETLNPFDEIHLEFSSD